MFKKLFLLILISTFLLWPSFSNASGSCTGTNNSNCSTITTKVTCKKTTGCRWVVNLANQTNPTVLVNPLGTNTSSFNILIGKVITAVMGVVGSLALLMFIYGGLIWMTSSGNQDKVKKGRDIILWSAIGLIVIFMSYALTRFILGTIAH